MKRRTILGISLAAVSAAAALTCSSPGYLIRAGIEEARILSRRRPIAHVAADPATSPDERRKLELVLQARDFAENGLGLAAGESYTTYSWVESDTLLLVVSGAYRDRFQPYTWWFPIVGRVPYKGFFDFDAAHAEAARLEREGFDASVRPSAAFSTLGWFNDPLLNTVLRYGEVSLGSTVIHELTHNTLYLPGRAQFNESFANFVGDVGAIEFFCARDGETSETCRLATAGWADNLVFGAFLDVLIGRLETLYGREDLTSAEKVARREDIFREETARFRDDVRPQLRTGSFRNFADRELDNAVLIGMRLYYHRLDLFERVHRRLNGPLRETIAAMVEAARERPDDPYAAVEALVEWEAGDPVSYDPAAEDAASSAR